jgi:DNA-binding NarL/FixJ family response regulator
MHVLVMERNASSAVLRHLARSAFRLDTAATLASGLQRLRERSFEAVLLDTRLLHAPELTELHEVREAAAEAAVVVLAARHHAHLAHAALRAGAHEVMVRGRYTAATVEATLRAACERRLAERERYTAAAVRAVKALASTAAHEINNPLTVVLGHLRLLERDLDHAPHHLARIAPALEAGDQIKRAVQLMTCIERVKTETVSGVECEFLDLRASVADDAPWR